MNDFQIIADGKFLDTTEEVSISLNYQIEDILDIAKRNTSFSKTITLPGTPSNNQFFKQIFDVNIDNINFNPSVKIPAEIRVGSNTVMVGNLQLLKINIDNEAVTYDISIFGELKNIINNLGDFTLKNLDFSEYNHTRDKDTIEASWQYLCQVHSVETNLIGEARGYIYPYIVNGGSSDIYDNAYIYDLFPSVYRKEIIDKLFDFAGFTYTSNFFNSQYYKKQILPFTGDKIELTAEEQNNRKAIVGLNGNIGASNEYKLVTDFYPGSSFVTGQGFVNNANWYENWSTTNWNLSLDGTGLDRESGTVTNGGSELTFTDEYGQWNGNYFTCNKAGRYNLEFDAKAIIAAYRDGGNLEYQSGNILYLYRMILIRDGVQTELDSSRDVDDPTNVDGVQPIILDTNNHGVNTASSPHFYVDDPLVFNMSAEDVQLQPGDEIRILVAFKHEYDVSWAGNDTDTYIALAFKESLDGVFTRFVCEPSSNKSYGNEPIELNNLLDKNLKLKDFFLDEVKRNNLIILDNPNKENDLIIEPREDFFRSKQKVKDWTQKLDRDSNIEIVPMSELDAKTYLYTYSEDSDLYNKEYTEETKRIYGDNEITVLNDFSEKTQKTQLMSSPSPMSDFGINGRVAPFFVDKDDENYKPKKVKPRVLFYDGLKDCEAWTIKDNPDDDMPLSLTQYPYCGMWDDPTNPTEDLGFGTTSKVYFNTSQYPFNNLYNKLHRATLANIINKNARLFKGSFYLTPKDIVDFDFRDVIFIDGSYWRVFAIKDFNPVGSDSVTKVWLYKLVEFNPINGYTINTPANTQSCPNDLIIKQGKTRNYYGSESGQTITGDCCSALGGDYINGVCYLPPQGNANPTQDQPPLQVELAPNGGNKPSYSDKDGNSNSNPSVKIQGSGNVVPPDVKNGLIIGDNNTILPGVENFVALGDGNLVTQSGYYQDGNLIKTNVGFSVIDGGEDEVLNIFKTNLIDVIDSGEDVVRPLGGGSKERPVIDGTKNSSFSGDFR